MKSKRIYPTKYAIVTLLLIGLYTLIMGVVCYLKFYNFGYDDFDLAIHTQSLAAILRGESQTTILGIPFLGNHMVLILYLIAPIYALFPSALTLLYLQTFTLAAGAGAVFMLARKELSPSWGITLAFAFLIYPPLIYMNLYEFHPVVLATTGLLFAMLAWKNGCFARFIIMLLLSMSCQENIALIAVGFGAFALLERKRWWWVVVPMISGVTYFAVVVLIIMPRINDTVNFQMLYSHLGDSMPEVAASIILHPIRTISIMLQPAKLSFLNMLLSPLAYLSLLSPLSWVPVGLVLVQRLLSARGTETVTIFHYQAEFIPFIFTAAIYGIKRLQKFNIKVVNLLTAIFIVAFPLAGIMISGVYPLIKYHVSPAPELMPLIEAKHEVLKEISQDAIVAATFELLAPLSQNDTLHSIHHISAGHFTLSSKPYPLPENLDFIIIDTNDRLTFTPGIFYKPTAYLNLQALLNTGVWKLVSQAESLIALQRTTTQDPRLPLAQTIASIPTTASTNITQTGEATVELEAFEIEPEKESGFSILTLFWKSGANPNMDSDMLLTVKNQNEIIYEVILSPGSRIWPPQSWPSDSIISDRQRIPITANNHNISVSVKMLPMTWQRGR